MGDNGAIRHLWCWKILSGNYQNLAEPTEVGYPAQWGSAIQRPAYVLELMSWLCLQDGKDYIPLTADTDVSSVAPDPRSPCNRPQSRELLDVQLHYDSPPALGSASWLFTPSWLHKGKTLMDVCCLMSPVQRVPSGWAVRSAPQHQDVWTHPRGK